MECTGHCSLDGVRSYKRTSDNQQETLSDIINLAVKEPVAKRPCSDGVVDHYLQSTEQMGLAPVQISLQNCSSTTFNMSHTN